MTKLSVLLSVYTGIAFLGSFDEIWEEIDRLSGQSVFNHDIPRIVDALKPFLVEQHPWLADIDVSGVNGDNVFDVLARLENQYGVEVEVHPAPSGKILEMHPIESLKFAGVDEDRIITFCPN